MKSLDCNKNDEEVNENFQIRCWVLRKMKVSVQDKFLSTTFGIRHLKSRFNQKNFMNLERTFCSLYLTIGGGEVW